MKYKILITFILALTSYQLLASDIIYAQNIKKEYKDKIKFDISLLISYPFDSTSPDKFQKKFKIETLNGTELYDWLTKRVRYLVLDNSFSSLLEDLIPSYPSALIFPFSLKNDQVENFRNKENHLSMMSNISAGLYLTGKLENQVYSVEIEEEKILIDSPRVGIIQINERLFGPDFKINQYDEYAYADSILRLSILFHEARHSDGNGMSLVYQHGLCPKGHDYEGLFACDENLNGPYAIATSLMIEMSKTCHLNCKLRDLEVLKLLIFDNAQRVLKTTHQGTKSINWDALPEKLLLLP